MYLRVLGGLKPFRQSSFTPSGGGAERRRLSRAARTSNSNWDMFPMLESPHAQNAAPVHSQPTSEGEPPAGERIARDQSCPERFREGLPAGKQAKACSNSQEANPFGCRTQESRSRAKSATEKGQGRQEVTSRRAYPRIQSGVGYWQPFPATSAPEASWQFRKHFSAACQGAPYSNRYTFALRRIACTYSRVSVNGMDSTNSCGSRYFPCPSQSPTRSEPAL